MGKGGPFQAEVLHVFRRPHMSRGAPLTPLLKEPRERCFFSCFLGQLKLSIDAQDRVLLLHSEYDYVQTHQGRRGVVPSCLELDRAWYHYGIFSFPIAFCHLSPDKVGAHLGHFQ